MIDQNESHGCCYAQTWDDVQFQRMPNVSLEPGTEKYTIDDMIKDVEKGIYIAGRGSYSIDQQRYNFQFGGTVFYESRMAKSSACWMTWHINPTPRNFGIPV